jgi:xanthine dehydrogenase accessory factor
MTETSMFEKLRLAIQREDPVAMATVVNGDHLGAKLLLHFDGTVEGSLGDAELDRLVVADATEMLPGDKTETRTYTLESGKTYDVYIESYLPPRRLVVVGAVHTAIPLVSFAKELGYHTTVIDARGLFASRERFPHADELIEAWPDEALSKLPLGPETAVVMLAHDPKFEDPAMEVVLKSRAGYIGAMGSRKTSEERNARLVASGKFTEEEVARIHGPIGINIGAREPAEVAISILAEIIAVRRGRDPHKPDSKLMSAKLDTPAPSA